MKLTLILRSLIVSCVALTVSGCSVLKPKGDSTQFYVLRPAPGGPALQATVNPSEEGLHIGPWRFPDYLASTPIAVQDGANTLKFLDLHQWAEPLDDGVSRVLAENLSHLLNVSRVVIYPDQAGKQPGFGIQYTVFKFEGGLTDEIVLEVYWQVSDGPSGAALSEARSRYVVPYRGPAQDAAAYVARMSEALGQWSQDIAKAINSN